MACSINTPLQLDINDDWDSSDASSVVSSPPVRSSVGSSQTSFSQRSGSPAPSLLSLTSSLREAAFRQEYGRGINNYSEVYWLPADEEEWDRLDDLYLTMRALMGKYPPPLVDILADNIVGEQKAVLDLGCGSGSWMTDIAREFPHCNVIGVDLIPVHDSAMPPDCRGEVDDINLGLEHFYGDFNVVHASYIRTGIRDYAGLIDQISHILRPGGLIEIAESFYTLYDHERQPFEVDVSRMKEPYFPRWFYFINRAIRERGGDIDATNPFHSWVYEHGAFEDVVCREIWIPICPYAKGSDPESRWNTVGAKMREHAISFIAAGRPLLLASGLEEEFIDELENKLITELLECRYAGLLRARSVYAIKKRPPLGT